MNAAYELPYNSNPYSVADAIKKFLRILPEPLIPTKLYDSFIEALGNNYCINFISLPIIIKLENEEPESQIKLFHKCISKLPQENRDVLRYLIKFLTRVGSY